MIYCVLYMDKWIRIYSSIDIRNKQNYFLFTKNSTRVALAERLYTCLNVQFEYEENNAENSQQLGEKIWYVRNQVNKLCDHRNFAF